MTLNHYEKHISNYAVVQPGSISAGEAGIVLGSVEGVPTLHLWDELRQVVSTNNRSYVGYFDDFLGDTVDSRWQVSLVGTGATFTINAQANGVARITLDTDDDDALNLAMGLHWTVSNGWTLMEASTKQVTGITARAIEIGFSDALTETAGLAFSNHSAAGVVAVADNAALFGYDTDASMTTWAINTVKAAGTPQGFAMTQAPSTSFQKLAVAIDSSGNAFFFFDGALVRRVTNAIATSAVITPWISLRSLSGAAKNMDVDYIYVSGRRS